MPKHSATFGEESPACWFLGTYPGCGDADFSSSDNELPKYFGVVREESHNRR